ncbi:M56 family metallopeptidase [Peptoniphilus sp. AGMB00490]|uniref:M56 family metallopeptidase n=1 Tax=Peptoniphilus faecalis TaxID=2731255 RepID=A0A848RFI9_9FIRM|nr:M56 family metallopeptidase [Peptoniphilus faecalis]NMW84163.1 M56 family metallopeptidase [Peptoniphilus faecalis]
MTISIASSEFLYKSLKSILIIILILLFRKRLNLKSIKGANIILWTLLLIYLIFPKDILFSVKTYGTSKFLKTIFAPSIFINQVVINMTYKFPSLSRLNRVVGSSLVIIYTLYQFIKFKKVISNSIELKDRTHLNKSLKKFNIKREIKIYINDEIDTPITYGIVKPKIILQKSILKDWDLLEHVLTHELVHIERYHILLSHLKNLIICLYWYNPFLIISLKYFEEDIEINCDKIVIEKRGDTLENRKNYCQSMLKLVERQRENDKFVLNLSPTKERMLNMKNWKKTMSGTFTLIFLLFLYIPVFTNAIEVDENQVISDTEGIKEVYVNVDNRVEEIRDEEYKKLDLYEIPTNGLRSANIDEKRTLEGLDHETYTFNMSSLFGKNHNGFTIRTSEMYCRGGVDYTVIIQENGNIIYESRYNQGVNLKIKANSGSSYKVIIINQSVNPLTYKINISSYVR